MPEGHPPIEIPADVVKAIEEMKKQADAAPDDVALWSRLAGVQYRAGLLDKRYLPDAAKSFEYVLAKDPQNLDALRFLGNIAFDQQLPVRAIDYYLRYLTLKPDDYSVMTDMATMYLARGDANTAVQFYNQVLSKQPQFFEALFNLGIAERSRGNNQAALVAFEKAKAAAPDERGKAQVDQVIARAAPSGGEAQGEAAAPGGSAGAPAAAAAPGDFRGGVEGIFRNHPMIGPKLERVEWESDGKARVLIREFPMAGMPPEIRKRFTDRLKTQVRERKQANQVTAAVTLELVDPATGSVMETLVE
jgi:tetratricopeptide (TPR) repeat protein